MATRPPAEGPRASRQASLVAIPVATALAYGHTLDAPFHLDDFGIIVEPSRLHEIANLWPPSGRRWVGDLTFALNYRLGGLTVTGYHLVNVAIHAATALLVAALVAVTLRTPAASRGRISPTLREHLPAAAGLLFAVHPLATQAVTYIVQRYTSLASLLYLLALVLYVLGRLEQEASGRATRRVVALASFAAVAAAAAMWTKEISLTLPVVAIGYEVAFFAERRRLLMVVPLAAAALIPLLDPMIGPHLATEANLPRWDYALTQARVVVAYLWLAIRPMGQNLDHDVALSRSLAEPAVLASLALLAALAGLGVWMARRGRRTGDVEQLLAGAAIGWYFVTLSVESSVLPIRDVMWEHRTYLPGVGVAVGLALALLHLGGRLAWPARPGSRATALVLAVAVPLGIATHRRNEVWRDDLALWTDTVAKSPAKARPRQFLGTAWLERGDLEAAERELMVAVSLDPAYHEALYNLGTVYLAARRLPEALEVFGRAVQVRPGHAMSHNNLGAVLQMMGDLPGAAAGYEEALRLDPGLAMARGNLARLRARLEASAPLP